MSLLLAFVAIGAASAAALCVFADGALLSLDEDEPPAGAARVLLARRERAHRALAFAQVLAQLLAGAAAAAAVVASPGVPARLLAPVVILVGILLVISSELAARAWGDAAGAAGLARVATPVFLIERLMSPVVAFGQWSDALLQRLLPPPSLDQEDREDAVERFREVVAAEVEASDEGQVLLHGVFSLGDTQVRDIMVPRVEIVGIERETAWSEVADRVRSARHARLVVFDGTIDEVVGILYAKDLLPALVVDEEPASGWLALVRPALFIPDGKRVEAQLREFRSSRRHIAIVVDEFGGTAGLVTLEDALELIIGDIQDEQDAELPDVEQESGGKFWLSARVTLEQFSELTGTDFTREDVATVGGLMLELLGRVPRNGEVVRVPGYRFVVERVVRRRVERVYVERTDLSTSGEAS